MAPNKLVLSPQHRFRKQMKTEENKKELTEIKMNNSISSKNVVMVSYKAVNQVNCETLKKGEWASLQKPK